MALWLCTDCSTAYAVGLSACPHCGSTDHYEEGAMPKITLHGGASNAYLPDDPGPELLEPASDTAPEEESSPGNSSETSSPKPEPKQKPSGSAARSRARTTANPSSPAPTAASTADGTAGDPTGAE